MCIFLFLSYSDSFTMGVNGANFWKTYIWKCEAYNFMKVLILIILLKIIFEP